MKKKFICTVCGYIYEGTEAPEKCPICKAPASKFKEMEDAVDDDMTFATVHVLGQAYKDGVNEDVIKGLKDHFNGECGEVGMYLLPCGICPFETGKICYDRCIIRSEL